MPDEALYEKLAAASTPEEIKSAIADAGAKVVYEGESPGEEPPMDGPPEPPMDEPPMDGPPMEESYTDGSGSESGRRAGILLAIKSARKKGKPKED